MNHIEKIYKYSIYSLLRNKYPNQKSQKVGERNLCSILGIKPETLNRWKYADTRNNYGIPSKRMLPLAQFFGISSDELYTKEYIEYLNTQQNGNNNTGGHIESTPSTTQHDTSAVGKAD